MEIIRRYFKEARTKANERSNKRLASVIEKALTDMVISGETAKLDLISSTTSIIHQPNAEGFIHPDAYQIGEVVIKHGIPKGEKLIQETIDKSMTYLNNPKLRLEIGKNTLLAAKKFWEEELKKPDRPYLVAREGRFRLNDLAEKIEKIDQELKK